MQFHRDIETIDASLSEEELEKAWRKQIEHSDAWQKHKEMHNDAKLVRFDSSTTNEDEQIKKKESSPVVKYDAETGHFPTATCNCGMHFELHNDTGNVYKQSEQRSESFASPYMDKKDDIQGGNNYARKGEPPSRFFSYKK